MTLQQKFLEMERKGTALLAANFYNFETISGIVQAAAISKSEIILQTSPSTINYLGVDMAAAIARTALRNYNVRGWLHLDHADSIDMIKICLDAGYDSVMIDASEKTFSENVKITAKVVELANKYGANVEAELGYVAKLNQSHEHIGFTKPSEAKKFVDSTGVNALAVAIGSAHGFYKKTPNLDITLLKEINQATNCALVLHGGSGIPDNQLRESIKNGIRKINLATEIKNIFMETLQNTLKENREIDLRKVFPPAIKQVEKLVQKKLAVINETTSL